MKSSLLTVGNRFRNSLLLVLFATNLFAQQVSFTTDVTSGCTPLKVKFTNTSSKGTTFYWNFKGIGLDLNNKAFDTSYIYTEPGQYTPSVTAFDSMGIQIASFLTTITVDGVPSTFYSSADSACITESISFSLYSQTTIGSYFWDFGDNSTSSQSYPSHAYSKSGTYKVTLIVNTTTCGNDTLSKTIIIKDNMLPATPSFSIGKNNVCPDEMINFYPYNYNYKSYKWTFGNGDSSSSQSTSYTYTKSGNYPVTLTVTNACGLSNSYTDTAKVSSNIGFPSYVSLYASPNATCPGDSISFSFSQNASSYLWKFSSMDSSVSAYPKYAYKDTGTYQVTLKATNGCGKDTTLTTTVNISKGAYYNAYAYMYMNPNPVYAGNSVSFYYNTSNAKSNLWNFGDSTTSIQSYAYHTYKNAGTYQVSLTLTNACGKDTVLYGNIVVNPAVQVSFTADKTSGCSPLTVKFTNTSSTGIKKFSWNFGSTSQTWNGFDTTYIFQNSGQYYVSLTAYDSLGNYMGSYNNNISVNTLPTAFYSTVDTACPNQSIGFNIDNKGIQINNYLWNFGDSTTSNQQYPNHYYSNMGTYKVTLVLNTSCGNDTLTKSIVVNNGVLPNVQFYISNNGNICPGDKVNFYPKDYMSKSYSWNFGDSTTSTMQSPTHSYAKIGNYAVTLTMTNSCGQTNKYTDTARIGNVPFPSWVYMYSSVSQACPGDSISFYYNYQSTSQMWKFGDGDSSTASNPKHAYKNTGNYTISLKLTNGCGKDTTLSATVAINNGLYFGTNVYMDIKPNPAYTGKNVTFSSSTTASTYLWNFGDSTTSASQYPLHTYNKAGTYNVSLKLTNGCGKDTTISRSLTVNDVPQISFTADKTTGCTPLTVAFTNTSSNVNNYSWSWSYNDGNQWTNGVNATHTFTKSGNFNVTLNANDQYGNYVGSYSLQITVNGAPSNFYTSADTACPGQTVGFSVWSQSPINSALWNFGDSVTSNQQNTGHSFAVSGTYLVKLIVGTSCGYDTLQKSIVVNNNSTPDAKFYINNSNGSFCPGDLVQFNPRDCCSPSYVWKFGDGDSLVNNNKNGSTITHAYKQTGNYPVTLTITNSCGNSNTYTDTVRINNTATFPTWLNIYTSSTSICPGDAVNFDYSYNAASQLWNFGDGDTSSVKQVNHTYSKVGTYNVTVDLMNSCGSKTTLKTTITVGNNTPFSGNPYIHSNVSTACPGDKIYFGANTTAATYLWKFGNGDSSTVRDPAYSFSKIGIYDVSLKLVNNCGKDTTVFTTIKIDTALTPSLNKDMFGAPAATACVGDTMLFYSVGGASYLWDFGDGQSTTQTSPLIVSKGDKGGETMTLDIVKHVYKTLGNYIVKLTYYNGCGKSASDTMTVSIGTNQAVNGGMAPTSTSYKTCEQIDFIAIGGTKYQWTFGDGDSVTTNAGSTSHTYTKAGNYTVSVVITNSCGNVATYTNSLTIVPIPTPTITANGSTLTASSAASYQWSMNGTTINGATAASYVATQSGMYAVTITDANGCTATSAATCYAIANASADVSICSGGNVKLAATGGGSYLWNTKDTLSSITVTPTNTTTYFVTVAVGSCTATDSVTVSVATALTANAGKDVSICQEDKTILTATGGGNYTWTPSIGLSDATIANPVATPNVTTSYIVKVTSGACSSSDTVVVTVKSVPTTPTITASGATTFCQGGTVTLTSSAVNNNKWSTGDTTQSIKGSQTGNYSVTVSNAGCTATSTATSVKVNSLPTVTAVANGATTFCQGGNVSLTASSGSSYLWTNGATTQNTTATASGDYSVTVTDANGCSATSTPVTVTVNSSPTTPVITASGITTFCQGGSVTLTSDANSYYLWSNGATTQSITVTSAGNYSVKVTNTKGCTATSSSTSVTVNSLPSTPTITASGATTFCAGGSVTLTSSAGNSYKWSTGETTASIVVTKSGNYTVSVTASTNGCSATSAATVVTVNPLPSANAGADVFLCSGGNVKLNATGGDTYSWTPTTALSASNITNPVASPTSNTTYIVTVTLGSCTARDTVNVSVASALTVNAGKDTSVCFGGKITLNATGGGNYAWSPSAGLSDTTIANPVASPSTTTSYVVKTTSGTCSNTDTVIVTVKSLPATPTITASGATTFCQGSSATLTASSASSYLWSTGETTQGITATNAGNYTVTITNAGGCSATSSATTINVNPLPTATITAGGATTFCSGDSVKLTASNGTAYLWSNGTTTSSTTVKANGAYTVKVTDAKGCSATSSAMTVTVNSLPTTAITGTSAVCLGKSTTLMASGGTKYAWNTSDTTASITVTPTKTTTYSVTVTSANCSKTTNATITVNSLPSVPMITAGGATSFCQGGSVTLTSSAANSYKWSSGDTTKSIMATVAGNYTVTITNVNGCSATSSATTVTINALPSDTITASGNTSFCNGDSVKLTAGSGTSYLWSTNATTQSITIKTAGNYMVKITGSNGCSVTSAATTVTVNSLPAVTITAGGATSFCSGDSVKLTASNGTSYLWSNGATTSAIAAKSAGNYTVKVIDANGCSATSSATTITVNQLPTATITASGVTTFCSGDSVKLTASNGTSYLWSNGASTSTIAAKLAGNYTVKVTDANGCSATSSATMITVNSLPIINANTDVTICEGTCSTLASVGGTSYSWSPTSGLSCTTCPNPVACPVITTTYVVTGTDANGCPNKDTIVIKVNPLPTKPVITQNGDTLKSTSALAYQWSLDGTPINGAIAQSYPVLKTGNYKVTITDANGCSNTSDSMHVDITGIQELASNIQFTVYPNPFSDRTTIFYSLAHQSPITLEAYNILGKRIAILVDANQNAGDYKVEFGVKELGYAEGVYFVRMKTDKEVRTLRVIEIE